MKEPNYIETLKESWSLVWHHKSLWALGVLAVFVGQFGLGDFVGKIWLAGEKFVASENMMAGFYQWFYYFLEVSSNNFWVVAWLVFLVLLFGVFIIFVSITAQGALVAAAVYGYKHKKLPHFAKFWNQGVKHFWKVLTLNIITKLILGLLLFDLLYTWNYFYHLNSSWSEPALILSLSLILFLALLVSVWFIYALGYIVVDDKNLKEANKSAWLLFSKHVLVSLELSIVLLFLGLLLLGLIALTAIIFYFPLIILSLFAGLFDSIIFISFGLGLGAVLLVVFIVLISGFFNAFTVASWMYMFSIMHSDGLQSSIIKNLLKIFKLKRK